MADFMDHEADEVSDGSESGDEVPERVIVKGRKSGGKKLSMYNHSRDKESDDESDEEDEDDDEEAARELAKDLINDEEEEEEGGDEEDERGSKRAHSDEDEDDDLDDDDLDLLEENLGYKIVRKKKRIKQDGEGDGEAAGEEEEEEEHDIIRDRDEIAHDLFGDDDEEDGAQRAGSGGSDDEDSDRKKSKAAPRRMETVEERIAGARSGGRVASEYDSEESEEDNFIVDDDEDGAPRPARKKKIHRHQSEAMQQAQDIFGVEFDFEDFNEQDDDQYDDEDRDEDDDEDEEIDEELIEETNSDGETVTRVVRRPTGSSRKKNRKGLRKSIFELYEPIELEKSHLTEKDSEIRKADVPERFQLRHIPVTPADDDELNDEANWIYENAFQKKTISIQNTTHGEAQREPVAGCKEPSAKPRILEALRCMRNLLLEVPFIGFYRKELIEPDLDMDALWYIYHWDEKWCQLQERKKNLIRLFENMQKYQEDKLAQLGDQELPEGLRLITQRDIERVTVVNDFDQLRDFWIQFQLYYAVDVEPMKQEQKQRDRQRRIDEAEGNPEELDRIMAEEQEEIRRQLDKMKVVPRKDMYNICREANIAGVAVKFGLTPDQFGENLRDNYQRNDVAQCAQDPIDVATEHRSNRFQKPEVVLEAAKWMVAKQISCDPDVRSLVRDMYFTRAKVKARPTKKGSKEIDENHPCYCYKYLINKPVVELACAQFLHLMNAHKEGLLEVTISVDQEAPDGTKTNTYFDEIKNLFQKDEYSTRVQAWNKLREEALRLALDKFLYPQLEKELKSKLLHEVQQEMLKESVRLLRSWLSEGPYKPPAQFEDYDDFHSRDGVRVLGFVFSPDNEFPAYAGIINGEGEVSDHCRLPNFMLRRNARNYMTDAERELRDADIDKLKDFILDTKPHVIGLGADNILTRWIMEDLNNIIRDLCEINGIPSIQVHYVPTDLALVYSSSRRAQQEFPDMSIPLRQAVSVARRLQDPLIEFTQLCTSEEEILCLKYHIQQENLPKDELVQALYNEFVIRVNEVGVDVNRCLAHPYTANMLQFVAGFGPRKAQHLLRDLKRLQTPILIMRTQLVTDLSMGAKIFINCAGFIKIDTKSMQDLNTDKWIDARDSTRIHPEAYEWARKMAVDALEYDEETDPDHSSAVEEVMEAPDKLRELDLDAFAEELIRQGFDNRRITLYDIRNELTHPYKELRPPFIPPDPEAIFKLLTKETPLTFFPGKLITGNVTSIHRRVVELTPDQEKQPMRNDETGLWTCPSCNRNDFLELQEVWSHCDTKACPGQPMGVRVRLDNGISGYVKLSNLSDKEVIDPSERVTPGRTVHARVLVINVEKFSCDLTTKSSDLNDANHTHRLPKDPYYDYEAEDEDLKSETDKRKKENRKPYYKRIILHPSFHNIDYNGAERLLEGMENGEAIIRPSRRGTDHLTLTWKVYGGINQHMDIREEKKDNPFSLGRSLFIGQDQFEDLDEILARFVGPMSANAREMINNKCFTYADGGRPDVMEELLKTEKVKQPSKIHYFISPSKQYPGKFLLSYLPRNSVRHEYISITPDGFRYRQQNFPSFSKLLRWFKEHFREPPPMRTPMMMSAAGGTPMMGSASAYIGGTPSDAVRKLASGMPEQMFRTLKGTAGIGSAAAAAAAGYGPGLGTPASNYGQPAGFSNSSQYPAMAGTSSMSYGGTGTPGMYPMGPPAAAAAGSTGSGTTVSRAGLARNSVAAAWGEMSATNWKSARAHNAPSTAAAVGTPGPALPGSGPGGRAPKTPLYATPGASSQMSISPTHTPYARDTFEEWNP